MKRLTQLTITNYRAFYNEQGNENKYQINLPHGENLLVYGENGSGKSSLFKALKDFFLSSQDSSFEIQGNIFTEGNLNLPPAEIKIKVSEKNDPVNNWNELEEIKFNADSPTTYGNVILTDASQMFLTYRNILKTYYFDIENLSTNPNLFEIFVEILLSKVIDSSSNRYILIELENLKQKIESFDETVISTTSEPDDEEPDKTLEITKGKEQIEDDLLGQLDEDIRNLNTSITYNLESVLEEINNYLTLYFKTNIKVFIKNLGKYLALDNKKLNKEIFLGIKYFDKVVENQSYQTFLNEARLSALACSIYLAAAKMDNVFEDNLNILFLDDIFIGLDTSNRIPLLKILNDDFRDFQIFITTYDRNWFEVTKNWFQRKSAHLWKSFELYTDDYTYIDKEIPKLLPYKDSLAQALTYYKHADYSASGNYLRKACEEVLRKILPPICVKDSNGNDLTKLSQMLDRALYFFQMIGLSTDDLDTLSFYLQSLMNPLSHYDINISVYRKEMKDVEQAIINLQKRNLTGFYFKLILIDGSMLKLKYNVDADTANVYEVKIEGDLWIYKKDGNPVIYLSSVPCKNINLYETKNGIKGEECHKQLISNSLKQFYEDIVTYENQKDKGLNIPILSYYESLYEYQLENKQWDSLLNLIKF